MVYELEHSIAHLHLSILRDKNTDRAAFAATMNRLGLMLAYEALKDFPLLETEIETPLTKCVGYQAGKELVLVPILRAGLGLVPAFQQFYPNSRVGHLGMYRDEETHEPHDYYARVPQLGDKASYMILDPMLATGGSACDAIGYLKSQNAENIRFVCVIAAPEGIKKVRTQHPDIPIFVAVIDSHLNENAFIVPGLGDAGDRYFGT